ncbi:DUF2786 domain-containing protein [Pelagerythrobacter marinus]|uniref:DUF2786 domain-containing protein n=1 Tax=Pelagerythrobacter marinus TaxID=538382 RepID=UPI002AC9630D|nr:DUF2786 domain-containing protein [Pelagerythrobacter marinus]WPZ06581.1 DUF2786 domain-containing protein [Pelagerythrobacter marinus]
MIDKSLLAKIRKCFALASSSNEHEAAAALAKARALMDEHGVDEAQLAMAEIAEATARASRTIKPPKWENFLCFAVRRALGVTAFIDSGGDRTYVGRGPAPEIAAYAFAVLFRRLKAARKDYIASHLRRCRPGRKRQRADIFCEAWSMAVFSKIAALKPEQEEDELVGRYLAEHHPGLVEGNSRSAAMKGRGVWDDWSRGHRAGRDVDLHSGVGGAQAPLAIA